MSHIVTLKILIDEGDEDRIYDGLTAVMDKAISETGDEDGPWIVDWKIDEVSTVNSAIEDSIVNETYAEGDAFGNFVLFSASESLNSEDGAGFWSKEYGWTTLDLATKFEACSDTVPMTRGDDAVWMAAPYGLQFIRLKVIESPGEEPIFFQCFAENFDHAAEQADNAYPNAVAILSASKN